MRTIHNSTLQLQYENFYNAGNPVKFPHRDSYGIVKNTFSKHEVEQGRVNSQTLKYRKGWYGVSRGNERSECHALYHGERGSGGEQRGSAAYEEYSSSHYCYRYTRSEHSQTARVRIEMREMFRTSRRGKNVNDTFSILQSGGSFSYQNIPPKFA